MPRSTRLGPLAALLAAASQAPGQFCLPAWSNLPGPGLSDEVFALTAWDPDGPGPNPGVLIAGGNFFTIGAMTVNLVAQFDGADWSPMGGGVNGSVLDATTYDPDGPGPLPAQPIIGGFFNTSGGVSVNGVARWDGTAWRPLGTGLGGTPFPAATHLYAPYDGKLVVGGGFMTAGGIPAAKRALWNGKTWSALGPSTGLPHGFTVFGGQLVQATYTITNAGVEAWTGSAWVMLGSNYPRDLCDTVGLYRGELIASGDFHSGNGPGEHIAAWDGVTWRPLGGGLNNGAERLLPFDPDGPGPMPELLIAGGPISQAGGQPAIGVAAWDGQAWSPLGSGTNGVVRALAAYRGQLYVAGSFTWAGGQPAPFIARWGCPQPPPCYPDCSGEGVLTVADFGCFQTRFVAGNSYADCNADGILTVADFGCFQTKFVLGCP